MSESTNTQGIKDITTQGTTVEATHTKPPTDDLIENVRSTWSAFKSELGRLNNHPNVQPPKWFLTRDGRADFVELYETLLTTVISNTDPTVGDFSKHRESIKVFTDHTGYLGSMNEHSSWYGVTDAIDKNEDMKICTALVRLSEAHKTALSELERNTFLGPNVRPSIVRAVRKEIYKNRILELKYPNSDVSDKGDDGSSDEGNDDSGDESGGGSEGQSGNKREQHHTEVEEASEAASKDAGTEEEELAVKSTQFNWDLF